MSRARHVVVCLVSCVFILSAMVAPAATQDRLPVVDAAWNCASFDAWHWAQSAYDAAPDTLSHLDPDGDGIACPELTVQGFGPALWATQIPATAEPAQVVSITDGDTFKVTVNGVEDTVRMYHIDTPELRHPVRGEQCGAASATNFLTSVLGYAPNGTVYLEYDQTERDRYDRRLAYVWYQIGDDVYFVNEVMVRNGWASSETYKPDTKYKPELDAAEQFSVDKVLGVRLECGRFGQDLGASPSKEQIRQAYQNQPNQGQLPPFPGQESDPAPPVLAPTEPPSIPQPAPANCDPSYPSVCIPPIAVSGDLDCGDINHRRFTVVPPDPHNFDGDFDGVGCES